MKLTAKHLSTAPAVLRMPGFVFVVLTISSGRLSWGRMWMVLGLIVMGIVVNLPLLARYNPSLLEERFKKRPDTKPFDKIFAALSAITLGGFLVLAGLDGGRYEWSSPPSWTAFGGGLLHFMGNTLIVWALCTNPHLEATARIQADRAHRVITGGPYRHIRHPMYTGMVLMFAGWPLVLGALWAYIPLVAFDSLLVWRTVREDRMLHEELNGYAQYATRTRYRLMPMVW